MEKVMMPISISTEDISKQITLTVLAEVEKRMKFITSSYELSEYPNQNEVMKCLKIGQEKLQKWYAMGLKRQVWSDKSVRIERARLVEFLRDNFEI